MTTESVGRILIVDDEVELKNILVEALASQGYETAGYTSAEEALFALRSADFDVLLTDLMMPGMDGLALVREAMQIDPNLVCIMMTGQGTIQTAVDAMKVGTFDYVLKPFRLQTMLPVLTRAMNTRHLRLENVQLREAVAIHELSETVAFTLDPQTVLSKLADGALIQSEADEVSILLPTSDGTELYVAAVRGEKRQRLLGERIPLTESISSWVARERRALILNGAVSDERFVALWPRPDIRSAISIPMQVANKLVGVINLNLTSSSRPFTLGQMKALTILAGTAAAALESASLYTQVKKAEENYRSIFDNAVEGMFQSTPEGRFLQVNPAMARILGYESPEEVVREITDIPRQIYVHGVMRDHADRLQKKLGILRGFEFEAYRKDGTRIWLSLNRRSVRDKDGRELYLEGSVEDITPRKQAEEELKQSERLLAEAQHLAHVGNWNWDLVNNVLSWSDEHYHILGLDPAEFDPNYISVVEKCVIPEDRDLVKSVVDGILENHLPFSFDYRIKRPNGEVRVVHSRGNLTCDELGTPIRMFGTAQDITERREAEEEKARLGAEIERQRQRLNNVVANVPGVVWEAWGQPDAATQQIDFVSDYVETMLGYSVDDWLSTPNFWLHIVHPDDRERAARESAASFAGGKSSTLEFRWMARDGHAVWVESNYVVIKDDGGRSVGLRGVTTEITERKRAEEMQARREVHALFRADVGTALGLTDAPLKATLELCTAAMVKHLHAAFARVWTLNRDENILELQASSGIYTHIDGGHARVPVGMFKIGRIAQEREPHITNSVQTDPLVGDKAWAQRKGMVAFAGYPLVVEDRLLGVLAMFSQQQLPADTLDALGSVADVISQGIDRKRAEVELCFQKSLLESQTEASIDGVLVVSPNREILSYNQRFLDLWGVTREQMIKSDEEALRGVTDRVVSPEEFIARVNYLYEHPGEKSHEEVELKDGRTFDRYSAPVRGPQGEHYGRVWYFHDITERKASQAQLTRLAAAVGQTADSIVITDADGNIEYVNPAFERISGYAREEVLGRNPRLLKSAKNDPSVYRDLWQTISAGNVWVGQLINKKKDGTLFNEHATISAVFDESGKIVQYVAVKQDTTRESQLEEQLRQSQKMEAIGQLAGGVAHDFNNLLTAINGYSSLALQRVDENHTIKGYLEEIKKAGDRAANLTRQLLAFGRKQILQPLPINLNDVVSDMNKMLRRLIGEDIVLTAKLDPALRKIKADPGQIEQVLVNLVVNARDAMPQGGILTIETGSIEFDKGYTDRHVGVAPGNYVMLAVSDTGTGMSEEIQARIFDPFFTTKEKGKGTGLGLSTVYGIIKQSGGNIWVYSEPGRGTTFKVYLPQIETVAPKTEAPVADIPVPGGSETILLVEDEDVVRGLARQILENAGYKILEVACGSEAIRLCGENSPAIDLLLTDVVMPETSGKEVADRLTELQPDLKVLFMSGYTDEAIVHHGVLDSNVQFIQKPFTPAALTRKVREVLDSELVTSD